MIRYYLGIDGGGTKTAFRLEGEKDGEALRELVLGAGNPNDIGMEACLALLTEGIDRICEGLERSEVSVFAGIAGFASGDNGAKIEGHLKNLGFSVFRGGSDVENALAISRLIAGDELVAVIAGTGSVAYSLHNGQRKMTGGLGWLLDSVGSAYFIGREGLAAAYRELDGRGGKTMLGPLCEEKLGMPLKDSVVSGAAHRLRPVLMTATVAILGLMPASLASGVGSDVQRPLATVIVYGLLFSTIITLYILPTLYYQMEKRAAAKAKNDDEENF